MKTLFTILFFFAMVVPALAKEETFAGDANKFGFLDSYDLKFLSAGGKFYE